MRQLLPPHDGDVDPLSAYSADLRPAPADRPWLLVNMVSSLDGATSVEGVSGALGGPADKRVFAAIRSVGDVILVAAGTARAERYRPPRLDATHVAARLARGQAALPRLAIVTGSLDLDLRSPLFGESGAERASGHNVERPIVLTIEDANDERRAAVGAVADVVAIGRRHVDLAAALVMLGTAYGARTVVCEGGPSLNGALVAAGLVDEWCCTVSPLLVGGTSARTAHGEGSRPTPMRIDRVLEDDGLLFTRSTRA